MLKAIFLNTNLFRSPRLECSRGQNVVDSPVHSGRVPPHRTGHGVAGLTPRGRQVGVAEAPRRAGRGHRRHGLHDALLWLKASIAGHTRDY